MARPAPGEARAGRNRDHVRRNGARSQGTRARRVGDALRRRSERPGRRRREREVAELRRDRRRRTARRRRSRPRNQTPTVCLARSWKFECTATTSPTLDLETGFLAQLAARRIAHVLVPFDVAAGDAPAAGVAVRGCAGRGERYRRRAGPRRRRRRGCGRRCAAARRTASAAVRGRRALQRAVAPHVTQKRGSSLASDINDL